MITEDDKLEMERIMVGSIIPDHMIAVRGKGLSTIPLSMFLPINTEIENSKTFT